MSAVGNFHQVACNSRQSGWERRPQGPAGPPAGLAAFAALATTDVVGNQQRAAGDGAVAGHGAAHAPPVGAGRVSYSPLRLMQTRFVAHGNA
jgi:hypothetical protein